MLDARPHPTGDPVEPDEFEKLFASTQPTPVVASSFPTRRELREIHEAASRKRPRRERRVSRKLPHELAAPVYALPAARPKKRFKGALTIVAVTGLFASAGIPAYAISSTDSTAQKTLAADTFSVSAAAEISAPERESWDATTRANLAQQRSDAQRDANYTAYMASGAREAGDDYPYFSELSNNQGGGLSPLNYFYRECVDFVAWRLNRDVGSTSAPYTFDWNYLTPGGGNAYQWKANWDAHGWASGTAPKVGSVAWFGYHVSYVSAVNDDGTVTLEEYNYASDHLYGTRTIPATDVISYLYAPPLP